MKPSATNTLYCADKPKLPDGASFITGTTPAEKEGSAKFIAYVHALNDFIKANCN